MVTGMEIHYFTNWMCRTGRVCDDSSDCDDKDYTSSGRDWYADADEDGYGNASQTVPSCDDALIEVASRSTDCDSDPMIYPTANEICDDVDNKRRSDRQPGQVWTSTRNAILCDIDGDGVGSDEYIGHFCPSYTVGSAIMGTVMMKMPLCIRIKLSAMMKWIKTATEILYGTMSKI